MTSPEDKYTKAAEDMDALVDKGMNPAMAWRAVDPTGEVQREQQKRQREIDDGVRDVGARMTHEVGENSQLKKIQEIFDSEERRKALMYYQATQIAKQQIKIRNY